MWPVRPLHTSSYDGLGVNPPAYPTAVLYTPSVCQKIRSAPQKHPSPKIAVSRPSGNGGLMGWSFTKWVAGTGISSVRPGSAVSASIICALSRPNMPIGSLRGVCVP